MSVINRLASALGRRDEAPNQELARELVAAKATDDIYELILNLNHHDRNVQSDCIKALYEIGYLAPELIAEYATEFLALLKSRNNRLVWGGMIALTAIAGLKAATLYEHCDEIKMAIEGGSVITVDRGIKALSIVAARSEKYGNEIFPYLLNHLANCRPKDVPQRAEAVLVAVNRQNKEAFIEVVKKRMPDMGSSQIKRLNKLLVAADKR